MLLRFNKVFFSYSLDYLVYVAVWGTLCNGFCESESEWKLFGSYQARGILCMYLIWKQRSLVAAACPWAGPRADQLHCPTDYPQQSYHLHMPPHQGTTYTKELLLISVANSWQKFSARSTKQFGRWRKSSAHHKKYSYRLIFLVFSKIHQAK
jgi:hypothetical protein